MEKFKRACNLGAHLGSLLENDFYIRLSNYGIGASIETVGVALIWSSKQNAFCCFATAYEREKG